jgi:plasmid maintenance system antidote protein VapI
MAEDTDPLPIILRAIILGAPEYRTVTAAARMLRIGRPALSNVLNGNADLSVELAARIEDVFQYSALDLLRRQAALKLAEYRRVNYWLPIFRERATHV